MGISTTIVVTLACVAFVLVQGDFDRGFGGRNGEGGGGRGGWRGGKEDFGPSGNGSLPGNGSFPDSPPFGPPTFGPPSNSSFPDPPLIIAPPFEPPSNATEAPSTYTEY